jgi:hypothetical protein
VRICCPLVFNYWCGGQQLSSVSVGSLSVGLGRTTCTVAAALRISAALLRLVKLSLLLYN